MSRHREDAVVERRSDHGVRQGGRAQEAVLAFVLMSCLGVACSSDSTSGPDRDAANDGRDEEGSDPNDLDEEPNPGIPTLEGTSLEAISTAPEDAVVLCDQWSPGLSLPEARRAQVQLSLPAQEAHGLAYSALLNSRPEGAFVETGPLSEEQWRPGPEDWQTSVVSYLLFEPEGAARLDAEITHEFAGVGRLRVHLRVQRTPGDPTPVALFGPAEEVQWFWEPPGAIRPVPLSPCDGEPGLERAIGVLAATHGEEVLLIERFWRTNSAEDDPSFILDGARVIRWRSSWPEAASTRWRWAQQYSAEEGHTGECSLIDFTRDLFGYHQRVQFDQGNPYGAFLERLTLDNLAPPSGVASIETRTLVPEGEPQVWTWSVVGDGAWRRVDAAALQRRALDSSCDEPTLYYLEDWRTHTAFLIATCPSTSGALFDLAGIVPIQDFRDPARIGEFVGRNAFIPNGDEERPGFTTILGDIHVEVSAWASPGGDALCLAVTDPDHPEARDVCVVLSSPSQVPEPERYLFDLNAQDESGEVRLFLQRSFEDLESGGGIHYHATRMTLWIGDEVHDVTAWDRLTYNNSHHNWNDSLIARSDERILRWFLVSQYEALLEVPPGMYVSAETLEGEEVLPMTRVE